MGAVLSHDRQSGRLFTPHHHRHRSRVPRCHTVAVTSQATVIFYSHCNCMEAPLCTQSALDPNVIVQNLTIMANEARVASGVVSLRGARSCRGRRSLEGWASPFFPSSSFTFFLQFPVFCFLTFQRLLTANLRDKKISHRSFIYLGKPRDLPLRAKLRPADAHSGNQSRTAGLTVYQFGPCLLLA